MSVREHIYSGLQDGRLAFRTFKSTPFATAVSVGTLALAIGLNTGVFTLVNALELRAPVKDPDDFIKLYSFRPTRQFHNGQPGAVSLLEYHQYESAARSVKELIAWHQTGAKLSSDERQEIKVLLTSCNFFSVYGLKNAALGRLFRSEECSASGGGPVVVLSDEIWHDRFLGDPHILGRAIVLNRRAFVVIGVAPPHFAGRINRANMWIPYSMQSQIEWQSANRDFFLDPAVRWLAVEGRRKDNYSLRAVQSELGVIAARLDRGHPAERTTLTVTNGAPLNEPGFTVQKKAVVLLCTGAMLGILILAGVNVTLLLLSRATIRQKEVAIRLALGASRARLFRMLLVEGILLAGMAGVLALYIAYWVPIIISLLVMHESPGFPLEPDMLVFTFFAGILMFAGCVAGMAPAVESLRVNLDASMREQGSFWGRGATKSRTRNVLVIAQVATSFVLLVGAGLFLHGYMVILDWNPGFETRGVMIVPLPLSESRFSQLSAQGFYKTIKDRVRGLAGVTSVSYSSIPPLGASDAESARLPGQASALARSVSVTGVSMEYFKTLGIPITRGRSFQATDMAVENPRLLAVVSQSLADSFWGGSENAIGKIVELANGEHLEIIGVVRNTSAERYGALDGPRLYRMQGPGSLGGFLIFRFRKDPVSISEAVRNVVMSLDPELIVSPRTLHSGIEEMAGRLWTISQLILMLAALAAALAIISLYALVSYAVKSQTKTFGIKMALGATKSDIILSVFLSSIRPVLVGLVCGFVLAFSASFALEGALANGPMWFDTGTH